MKNSKIEWTDDTANFVTGCIDAAQRIVLWCRARRIPVFCKDNINHESGLWPKEIL